MNRGYHHIIDFYGCDPAQIEHQPFWDRVLHDAADKACMEVLCAKFHKFDPRGLTGFLLLSTSHLSVDTWPEHRHAACDLFSCAAPEHALKAVAHLIDSIEHEDFTSQTIERGYESENVTADSFSHEGAKDQRQSVARLELPVYSTGECQKFYVEDVLLETESDFQKILVARITAFGRCLLLNDVMQCAEVDHHIYDKALLSPLRSKDRRILILGGGDGYV